MKIVNAKIYTCDKDFTVIENGFVEVEKGKITAVGECAPYSEGDIDAQGKSLFPGFIDCHTHLGLTTSGVGFEGEDLNESVDSCTPQLRIIDGINPLDYSFELARKAGVTAAVVSAEPPSSESFPHETAEVIIVNTAAIAASFLKFIAILLRIYRICQTVSLTNPVIDFI